MSLDPSLRDQLLKVTVRFERRDDGGMTIRSDDLPGLHLSHSDPSRVVEDVKPALEVLLTDMLGERVSVQPLISIREALSEQAIRQDQPGVHEYVTKLIAA
jgi:hypothetical protein